MPKAPPNSTTGNNAGWEFLPHDADVCVFGWGTKIEDAFEQAALALTAIVTNKKVADTTKVNVVCNGADLELLFVEWLNAIVYEMSVRAMLFGKYEVLIEGTQLTGTLWGEPIDRLRHTPVCEPKGATYTALSVKQDDGNWTAKCVVDV